MDNFGDMGVNMGVTVRVISKEEEQGENKAYETAKPVIAEKIPESLPERENKENNPIPFRYEKGYRPKTAYTRLGFGAVIVTGAVLSAVMLLALWGVKSFFDGDTATIADRIICEII